MKKSCALLAALILSLSASNALASGVNLDGLSLTQLEALGAETDARIRLLRLPDAQGYLPAGDAEALARAPGDHLGEKIRLDGEVFRVLEAKGGIECLVSPLGNPARVFLVRYTPAAGERRLLPGDRVSAWGAFAGVSPYSGEENAEDGALLLDAELVTSFIPPISAGSEEYHPATRQNPAPAGAKALYGGSWWTGYASYEIELLRSLRGAAALKKAKELSAYNVMPGRNQEYLLVYLRVKALAAPGGRADIAPEDFSFVSALGAEYRHHFLIGSSQALRNLFEGGEQEALVACLIDKGDAPLLTFQPVSPGAAWFDPD